MDNLPRYFAIKSLSDHKYLRYIHEESAELHGHVEFSGDEVISLYTKFALEPAKNEACTGLFNIRCCYNNKYWTRKEENTRWITATADEPVEDRFKWSSTLFQPSMELSNDGKSILRLCHVQHDQYVPVSVGSGDLTYRSCFKVDANPPVPSGEEDSSTSTAAFSVVDWESFVILPELVMFKADDGAYLYANDDGFLQFISTEFRLDSIDNIPHEILYTRDGFVSIIHQGHVWTRSSGAYGNWIMPKNIGRRVVKPDELDSLFRLVKGHGGDNEVSIQNMWDARFCRRNPDISGYQANSIIADAFSCTVKSAIIRVEEPVALRSIYNVNFRLEHARIYNQSDVILVSKQFNNLLDVDEVTRVMLTLTNETTRTWNSIVTLKLATPTTIETSVPSIVDGEVGLSDEFEGLYEWGTNMKGSETTELSVHVNIPARSTITVRVIATKGKCDVPFSYMQRDTRTFGRVDVTTKKEDGVYTGVNYYNFKAQVVKTIPLAGKS